MPAFEYKALNRTGREQSGVIEGDTARQARQLLREMGLVPLNVGLVEAEKAKSGFRFGLSQGLKASELALFTRQLATLVRSGTPLESALSTTAKQNEKPRIKKILTTVRAKVNEGHSLEAGLSEFPAAFPELYRATVAAGEKSGHLDAVLERLADYAENRQEMQQRIGMALFYPLILTVVAVLVAGGLLTYVVPQVVQVFEHLGQQLPWLTRALIAVSDSLKTYGLTGIVHYRHSKCSCFPGHCATPPFVPVCTNSCFSFPSSQDSCEGSIPRALPARSAFSRPAACPFLRP